MFPATRHWDPTVSEFVDPQLAQGERLGFNCLRKAQRHAKQAPAGFKAGQGFSPFGL
jgi:hypothetical protein